MTKENLLYFLLILVFCSGLSAQQFVPGPEELEGLQLSEEPQYFDPDNLWDYINGAAISYNAYDFQKLTLIRLADPLTAKEIKVEIYDMNKHLNAFGIYSSEKIPRAKSADVGINSFTETENLFFWQDKYYVKIINYEQDSLLLKKVAEIIDAKLPDTGSFPPEFKLFPQAGKIEGSERYSRKEIFGQQYLTNGFICDYQRGSEAFSIYLLLHDDTESCHVNFAKYFHSQTAKKKNLKYGEQSFQVQDDYYGPMSFIKETSYIIAIVGTKKKELIAGLYEGIAKRILD